MSIEAHEVPSGIPEELSLIQANDAYHQSCRAMFVSIEHSAKFPTTGNILKAKRAALPVVQAMDSYLKEVLSLDADFDEKLKIVSNLLHQDEELRVDFFNELRGNSGQASSVTKHKVIVDKVTSYLGEERPHEKLRGYYSGSLKRDLKILDEIKKTSEARAVEVGKYASKHLFEVAKVGIIALGAWYLGRKHR